MGKHQNAKTTTSTAGQRSARPNGKAWGRGHVDGVHPGHRLTGRTKPTGRTVGGHSLKKLGLKATQVLTDGSLLIDPAVRDKVRETRRHPHRAELRRQRRERNRRT